MVSHTGPGYWKISNMQYGYYPVNGEIKRKKNHYLTPLDRDKPWLAVYVTDNPYSDRKPERFHTFKAALAYAVLGGTPIAPEIMSTMEER